MLVNSLKEGSGAYLAPIHPFLASYKNLFTPIADITFNCLLFRTKVNTLKSNKTSKQLSNQASKRNNTSNVV